MVTFPKNINSIRKCQKNNFNGFRLPWQRLFQIVLGNSRRLLELVNVNSALGIAEDCLNW